MLADGQVTDAKPTRDVLAGQPVHHQPCYGALTCSQPNGQLQRPRSDIGGTRSVASSSASATSSAALLAPNFCSSRERCLRTVCSPMPSLRAVCLHPRAWTMQSKTSPSRALMNGFWRLNLVPCWKVVSGPWPAAVVVHHQLYVVAPRIGEEVALVRLRNSEDAHYRSQQPVGACLHVYTGRRQPHGVDANHRSNSRSQAAQSAAAVVGHLTTRWCLYVDHRAFRSRRATATARCRGLWGPTAQ